MATFARLEGRTSMKLTPTLIVLAISVIAAHSAHAEKYCKSVDQSGNATYTLAPETGCNKKRSKTVGVHQFVAPVAISTSTANTESNNSASDTSTAPAVANPAPAAAVSNATETESTQ